MTWLPFHVLLPIYEMKEGEERRIVLILCAEKKVIACDIKCKRTIRTTERIINPNQKSYVAKGVDYGNNY